MIMKMSQFSYLFYIICLYVCLKSSNIEGNAGRSASNLLSADAKDSSG